MLGTTLDVAFFARRAYALADDSMEDASDLAVLLGVVSSRALSKTCNVGMDDEAEPAGVPGRCNPRVRPKASVACASGGFLASVEKTGGITVARRATCLLGRNTCKIIPLVLKSRMSVLN